MSTGPSDGFRDVMNENANKEKIMKELSAKFNRIAELARDIKDPALRDALIGEAAIGQGWINALKRTK